MKETKRLFEQQLEEKLIFLSIVCSFPCGSTIKYKKSILTSKLK
jgi:hypothetical protein